ncbi:MAG: FAD-dependent monooxygenase [Ardenticatenaceae bacterium]|nr:FAD-dependent monooxygenase [Ardenticatenaceae bacterium]
MKILIVGGGPGGLYAGLLLKKDNPTFDIEIIERNPEGVTWGWGVVFSDRTLGGFQEADPVSYQAITDSFVLWSAIDTHYRGQIVRCDGHSFAGMSRHQLLQILQDRCRDLGITMRFEQELTDFACFDDYDLVIAADGVNSFIRKAYADYFQPEIVMGKAKFIWFGTTKVLDAFTFIFRENEHGLFQVHSYPFNGTTSTFIVECTEDVWRRAGLDKADEAASIAYCEKLFADFLDGAELLSNRSLWVNFTRVKCKKWRHKNIVLLGDAVHTAHFSIGSGTKLAMEDSIALAQAFAKSHDLAVALSEYEMERRPRVQNLQEAAQVSRVYFENMKRYTHLEPLQFTFQLLTRSGRITYDNLRTRDPYFVDGVDRWYGTGQTKPILVQPPPLFTPLTVRESVLPNRVVVATTSGYTAVSGQPDDNHRQQLLQAAQTGAALLLTEPVAVAANGRITSGDVGLYNPAQGAAWREIVAAVHAHSAAKVGVVLNHAGRRGATQPRQRGMDRPLRRDSWELIAPSALPYLPISPVPRVMEEADCQQVCEQFVAAARMAEEAGFDWLQLHMAHGYLLGSFISPLTNRREDVFGGSLENRLRWPLLVLDAVRQVWSKPLSVALTADDWAKGGMKVADVVGVTAVLREHGCDMIEVLAGQTIADDKPDYQAGFLTSLSDQLRHEGGLPVIVGGYLTTSGEINTLLAAGRADLCIWHQ